MPPLADAAAHRQIREDLGTSFIVEAAAGTGKTTEIINRVVAVLAAGVAEVGRIVVVTFTNKAAGELKLRLRAELERRRQQTTEPEIRRRLDDAVTHLEEARISTIHSFCGDLLAERPVESRIDPAFRLLAEADAERLFSAAFQDWIEARLADPSQALRRLLCREFRGRSTTEVLRADAEFQDTSALQAEILLLLAADHAGVTSWRDVRPTMGKLFIVGDPKQSIYGFRRADMRTYRAVKEQLEASGVVALQLTTSFRALPEIQRVVNAAFEPEMQGDLQPAYVALSPYRTRETEQPSVIALPIPKPYGKDGVTKTAIRSSLPDAVGAFVSWLVNESGWKVQERGALVDVAARHVCLLFRNFKNYDDDLTRPYVSALEARDIDTDVDLHEGEYHQQIGIYVTAIERAMNVPTRGVLLRV